jgi:hypothetical protein
MKLVLNEPVAVPWPGGDSAVMSVYWVRIYRTDARAVVIISDVPGNHGTSPTNGASAIALYISREYLPDAAQVRWFLCYPAGHPGDTGGGTAYSEVWYSGPAMMPDWGRRRRRRSLKRRGLLLPEGWWKVRLAIEGPLRLLPPQAEVLERVLAAGGELDEAPPAECYLVVPVTELPPPHHPFRCAHAKRFEKFVEAQGGRDQRGHIAREVREKFYGQLSEQDYAACSYHDGDWLAIAGESVRIIRELGEMPDPDALVAALTTAHLNNRDRSWLWSMFRHEPVMWSGDHFVGGQHRACALRASGAREVVRPVDGPPSGPPRTWTITGKA